MRPWSWLIAFCLVFPLGSARADLARATLTVSAQVLPHASLQATQADDFLLVTPEDLGRGYVDVTRSFDLRTNAPDRVLVQLQQRVGLARAIDVAGFGGALRMAADEGAELTPRASGAFDLRFRVWLVPEAQAGRYELPVRVTVVTL